MKHFEDRMTTIFVTGVFDNPTRFIIKVCFTDGIRRILFFDGIHPCYLSFFQYISKRLLKRKDLYNLWVLWSIQ